MKHILNTPEAPAPIGPYSQAVKSGHLLYTSGQIPIAPSTGALVLENLKAVVEGAGSTLGDVIKTTVFLADMADFTEFNVVYAEYFGEETAPARSTVQVAALPMGSRVEIELIAKI